MQPVAYSGNPTDFIWWASSVHPETGKELGAEVRIASWLFRNLEVGEMFTTRQVRDALGDQDGPRSDEHFQRRLRELRGRYGWKIPSKKHQRTIPLGHYLIQAKGWAPETGRPRPPSTGVSAALRRKVLDRDGRRCVVCGISAGDEYPGLHDLERAVLTVGHIRPVAAGGQTVMDNLQSECSLCNEPARATTLPAVDFEYFSLQFNELKSTDKRKFVSQIHEKRRQWTAIDRLFVAFRQLSPGDQHRFLESHPVD